MVIPRLLSQIEATSARYARRAEPRAETAATLRDHGILYADDHERVKKRLKRLNASWALARAIETKPGLPSPDDRGISPREPAVYGADVLGLERLMGSNDLIDIAFLERGAIAARGVGRITAETAQGTQFGTGFLVSPNLLLTNNHVLASAGDAARSYVEFDYQEGLDRLPLTPQAFALDPDRFLVTDAALDFTLVAVRQRSAAGEDLTAFGFLPLIEQEGKVILGELVNIIQHPDGEPKQLAIRENRLVDLLDNFLHYSTDTSAGSSGAPVFNDQWEVIGLHHSGVPKMRDGSYVATDDTLWTPDRPETELAWVANEGLRVSVLLRALRERTLEGVAAELRAELLDVGRGQQPRPAPRVQPSADTASYATTADGASFSVPLRVTMSLGSAPPAPRDVPMPVRSASPSTAPPRPEQVEPEVEAALAAAEASRERPYYLEDEDAAKREEYYASIPAGAEGEALFSALSKLTIEKHVDIKRYDPKKHVYPWVDLHPDRQLRSIYSGKTFPPEALIRADARIEAAQKRLGEIVSGGREASAAEVQVLEAQAQEPFNCEHVVPQSTFQKAEPMRGDVHHLFACDSRCNSFRGNTPYFDFADFEEKIQQDCGKREGADADAKFEPSNGKGAVARATLYFLLRYPGLIGDRAVELQARQLPLLLEWHRLEPAGEWERHRNAATEELQGNRNPLVDHPEWATKIDFTTGFGKPA